MTLNSYVNLKEKLICGFKYDMKNLVSFHPTTQKSENFTSTGSLHSYRGVISHDTEQ